MPEQKSPKDHPDYQPLIGLCSICTHAHTIPHPRGGAPYIQCALAAKDKTYEKYPHTPVTECLGFSEIHERQ